MHENVKMLLSQYFYFEPNHFLNILQKRNLLLCATNSFLKSFIILNLYLKILF